MARARTPRPPCRRARTRAQAALDLLLAQLAQQIGQRNLHRADDAGTRRTGWPPAAGRARSRRRRKRASAPSPSAPDRPSRRRGRRSSGRPDSGSCRRRSECSAACPGTRRRADRVRPASTSTKYMCSGPSDSPAARVPVSDREVVRDRLAGRRARQQAHQGGQIVQRRQHLLDAGDHDVHRRQDGAHALVALVGDIATDPVSAIRKLAPVTPMSADRKWRRSTSRASRVICVMSVRRGACARARTDPRPRPCPCAPPAR